MQKFADRAVTGLTFVVAIAITITFARIRSTSGSVPVPRQIPNWTTLAAEGHRQGPARTPIVIVEFADFQCPACEQVRFAIDSLRAKYSTEIAVVYRHYPLWGKHRFAAAAANAAECAGRQGRFFEYHSALFDRQEEIGAVPWTEFAKTSGVADAHAFTACVEAGDFLDRVERDAATGDSIGIVGTPTLIVNGTMYVGAVSMQQLEKYVKAAGLHP